MEDLVASPALAAPSGTLIRLFPYPYCRGCLHAAQIYFWPATILFSATELQAGDTMYRLEVDMAGDDWDSELARLGVTILPPEPPFYLKPQTIDDIVSFVVQRTLAALGVIDALPESMRYEGPGGGAQRRDA